MGKKSKKEIITEEKKQIKAISDIDDMKITANNHYIIAEYDKAIQVAEQILNFAKKDGLTEHVKEQEEFIQKCMKAKKNQDKNKVFKETCEEIKKQTDNLIEKGEIIEAHRIKTKFEQEYEEEFDFRAFPIARDLIKNVNDIYATFFTNQKKMQVQLNSLENEVKSGFESNNLKIVNENLKKAKEILPEFKIDNIDDKWKSLEEDYSKQVEELTKQLQELEKKFEEKHSSKQSRAALQYCEKILDISQLSEKADIEEKYSTLFEELKTQVDEEEANKIKEQEELAEKAKELEQIIQVEEDTIPLVEEFTVSDLLGNLSEDISETLEKIGDLLTDHRVEIKKEISNKVTLTSASGETVEIEKTMEILQDKEVDINYNVQSGLENPFDDVIEEAVLTDLIPYNFEITNVELNGEKVEELPDKTLTKEGLEINWQLQNIAPKEKVEIAYDLRRRISRTIIFMLKDQLKIVKAHSNLGDLESKGLYEVNLPFTNSFGFMLKGVVIEDIMPLHYVHFVKEPRDVLPDKSKSSEMGELVKWNVGNMEEKTINYNYKLLELYKLQEIKIEVDILDKMGVEAINSGNIVGAIMRYNELKNYLQNYI